MAATGAAAAAIAQAIQAAGSIVRMEPREFQQLLYRIEKPVIIVSYGGVFSKKYQYLTSYRGFAFHTKTDTQMHLPGGAEVISAKKIWVPNM